jgi:hypothetical protein
MRHGNAARARDPRPGIYYTEGVDVPAERPLIGGGLLLYHFPSAFWVRNAATILDHVGAFETYSRFPIRTLNTDWPFPAGLANLDFELVIVHYSVVGGGFYPLTEDHLRWLKTSRAHKVLLVQDEHRYCGHRFWFCDEVGFDTLYTCLEPSEFEKVYGSHTRVRSLRTNLPGYVSEQMVADGERLSLPDEERPIDVGYRGRPLPPYSGRGGLEKYEIGRQFAERAANSGLVLDIGLEESDRLYGKDWPRFLSRCKGVLGVESGVSVFDLDDRVIDQYERLVAQGRTVSIEDLTEAAELEDKLYYRTISPRHFEAAAMRVCQILYEGRYSGILQPMVHYIPLRKDFSNLDEVLTLFRDPQVRHELTQNAHRDLIASGRYSYERFIERFDEDLIEAGITPEVSASDVAIVERAVDHGRRRRAVKVQLRWISQTTVVMYVLLNLFKLTGFLRRRARSLRHRLGHAQR